MKTERAIELLHRISDSQFDGPHGDERREALEMAVRALEGDGDLICRQDAIDCVSEMLNGIFVEYEDIAKKAIGKLPSAQQDDRVNKIAELVDGTIDHFDRDDAMDLLYQIKEVLK